MAPAPFIVLVAGTVQSERQKNLDSATARSHAARVAHSRRGVYGPKRLEELERLHVTQSQSQSRRPKKKPAQQQAAVMPPIGKLFKGNSDPFQVAGLEITPEVNRILCFAREVMVPGQYYNSMYRRLSFGPSGTSSAPPLAQVSVIISRGGATRDWLTTKDSLQSECAVLARLSAYASVMAKVNPDLEWARMASLKMRDRAISLLRKGLQDSIAKGNDDVSQFLLPLYGLFNGECVDGNVKAAFEHSKIIRQIFESGVYTIQILLQVLYNDVDLAVKCGHRTYLDVDGWCPKVLAGLSQKFSQLAAARLSAPQEEDLHPQVSYQPLRRLWLARMAVVQSIKRGAFQAQQVGDQQLQDLVFAYFTASGFTDHGQLNNMYHDLFEAKILQDKSAAERYTLAGMIATLQYLARRVGHDCIINGVDVRDASPKLMAQMKSCIQLSLSSSDPPASHEFADAQLWMAYVGALEEERRRAQMKARGRECNMLIRRGWFTTRFQDQAQLMGIRLWSEVQTIAERFLHVGFVDPHGSLWVEDLINP
jgi:hypothetical protein